MPTLVELPSFTEIDPDHLPAGFTPTDSAEIYDLITRLRSAGLNVLVGVASSDVALQMAAGDAAVINSMAKSAMVQSGRMICACSECVALREKGRVLA
jgi:hypothetical protein